MCDVYLYNIAVYECDDNMKPQARYDKLQGILVSSYSPINYTVKASCFIYMYIQKIPSRAVRFELLYVRRQAYQISFGLAEFNRTAKAGDTLLVTASYDFIMLYLYRRPALSMFIIRYECKYFYRIIYKLYCLYSHIIYVRIN